MWLKNARIYSPTAPEARSSESVLTALEEEIRAALPLELLRENPSLASSRLTWLRGRGLCLCGHVVATSSVSALPLYFSSEDTCDSISSLLGCCGVISPPHDHFTPCSFSHICKDLFPHKVTYTGSRDEDLIPSRAFFFFFFFPACYNPIFDNWDGVWRKPESSDSILRGHFTPKLNSDY